jgi:ArsR family transcriptional regulator
MNIISLAHPPKTRIRQSELFKTLSHPARLRILEILRGGEECVCHMEATLGYRQAYLSQQLAVLRDAGIVEDRRDGWNIYYHVILPDIYAVLDAANLLAGESVPAQRQNTPGCPCPKCNSKSTNQE